MIKFLSLDTPNCDVPYVDKLQEKEAENNNKDDE
jgi:hypothetical protein